MTPLYAYSLIPVLSIALLLMWSGLLYGRRGWGLSLYCATTALWAGSLMVLYAPRLAFIGQHLAACGALVVAAYLHAAYDMTKERRYGLVWLAWAIAILLTSLGIFKPGLLYDPLTLSAGPYFWHGMILAVGGATVPLFHLAKGWIRAPEAERGPLRLLFLAGLLGYAGAWSNAILLAHGKVLPYGMLGVLASLLLLAGAVRSTWDRQSQRLLDRSLLYAALTALLSVGFVLGVLVVMGAAGEPLLAQYSLSSVFVLFMAALAVEPVRAHIQGWVGRRLVKGSVDAEGLAKALTQQEERADHAERLAEIGALTSAVAHEVRNPLGVLGASLTLLERTGADGEIIEEMRGQIARAEGFVEDLLTYGRPRPLELRMVDVEGLCALAISSGVASYFREGAPPGAEVLSLDLAAEGAGLMEADQGALLQVLIILIENALHAMEGRGRVLLQAKGSEEAVILRVEDDGPGVPPALVERLFEPFVTGRKREGRGAGTGLGLAIARGIITRHGGALILVESSLGGAGFEMRMPRVQGLLSAVGGVNGDG